jgi:WD40 repeat protein
MEDNKFDESVPKIAKKRRTGKEELKGGPSNHTGDSVAYDNEAATSASAIMQAHNFRTSPPATDGASFAEATKQTPKRSSRHILLPEEASAPTTETKRKRAAAKTSSYVEAGHADDEEDMFTIESGEDDGHSKGKSGRGKSAEASQTPAKKRGSRKSASAVDEEEDGYEVRKTPSSHRKSAGGTVSSSRDGYKWKIEADTMDSQLNTTVYTENNLFIATASEDKRVRLWDCLTTKPVMALEHPHPVKNVIFTASNSKLITIHPRPAEDPTKEDGYVVVVWDMQTQSKILSFVDPYLPTCQANMGNYCVAVDNAESRIVTASLTLWNLQSGEKLSRLDIQGNVDFSVKQLIFSSDDTRIISAMHWKGAGADLTATRASATKNDVVVFDSETLTQVTTLTDHPGSVQFLVAAPAVFNVSTFASSDAHTLIVWNHLTLSQLFTVNKEKEFINGISYGGNENLIMASCCYGFNVWDMSAFALTLDVYSYTQLNKIVYNPVVNAAVCTFAASNCVCMYDIVSGDKLPPSNKRHGKFVNALACCHVTSPMPHGNSANTLAESLLSLHASGAAVDDNSTSVPDANGGLLAAADGAQAAPQQQPPLHIVTVQRTHR